MHEVSIEGLLRKSTTLVLVGLCLLLAPAGHAAAKKKKKVDLTANPLANVQSKQPDKELFDKAMKALKQGKYDVARLDLQTLLNTYPESEYQMRAKLAVGDTWFREGGTAAMAQAEQEYKDFITFFPNTPEAAEAQMKVGDIYFAQMDKPDRDDQNAVHAEQEYRQMIQQFPDSSLIPRAKQQLREVQEILATRQFNVGEFYMSRENYAAAIARLQTVADTYPLFSHQDMTLISIGDAYAQQAALAQRLQIPAKAKEELVKAYNDRAASEWERVVTRYATSPHVEDAKDRLIAAGRPVPEPTAAELAEAEAEESSRPQIKFTDRVMMMVKRGPTTIESARVGEPAMTDPAPTLAPAVTAQTLANFNLAINGKPVPPIGPATSVQLASAVAPASPAPASSGEATPAVTMENVPDTSGGASGGNNVGVEIVNPTTSPAAAGTTTIPSPGTTPAANVVGNSSTSSELGGTAGASPTNSAPVPAANPDRVFGLAKPVGPDTPAALPPIDKPAQAPDQINDVKSGGPAQVATGTTSGKPGKKNPKPGYKGSQESSSKHKPKKGVDKLNPF